MDERQPNEACPHCGYAWGHKWGCELENAEYAATLAEGAFKNEEHMHNETRDELDAARQRIAALEAERDQWQRNAEATGSELERIMVERDELRREVHTLGNRVQVEIGKLDLAEMTAERYSKGLSALFPQLTWTPNDIDQNLAAIKWALVNLYDAKPASVEDTNGVDDMRAAKG